MDWIETISCYVPKDEQESKDKELILHGMRQFEDILNRNNKIMHMTCSAFVVNKKRDKVLMVYHNIYDSWSWLGGHADGEADLNAVALREAKEETGVIHISSIMEDVFSLDVLPVLGHVRRGEYVSAHLHLSVTYLFEADEEDELMVKPDENSAVQWIPIDQVNEYSKEPHMKKIYAKLIKRAKEFFGGETSDGA